MDLSLLWDDMPQQNRMKNIWTKCHRLWEKLLQLVDVVTNHPNFPGRNVTILGGHTIHPL
jgi:hypothetical protein